MLYLLFAVGGVIYQHTDREIPNDIFSCWWKKICLREKMRITIKHNLLFFMNIIENYLINVAEIKKKNKTHTAEQWTQAQARYRNRRPRAKYNIWVDTTRTHKSDLFLFVIPLNVEYKTPFGNIIWRERAVRKHTHMIVGVLVYTFYY